MGYRANNPTTQTSPLTQEEKSQRKRQQNQETYRANNPITQTSPLTQEEQSQRKRQRERVRYAENRPTTQTSQLTQEEKSQRKRQQERERYHRKKAIRAGQSQNSERPQQSQDTVSTSTQLVPETVLESDEEITNTNEILQAESQRTYAERRSIVANEGRHLNVAF